MTARHEPAGVAHAEDASRRVSPRLTPAARRAAANRIWPVLLGRAARRAQQQPAPAGELPSDVGERHSGRDQAEPSPKKEEAAGDQPAAQGGEVRHGSAGSAPR
jgi:hypothetical protein